MRLVVFTDLVTDVTVLVHRPVRGKQYQGTGEQGQQGDWVEETGKVTVSSYDVQCKLHCITDLGPEVCFLDLVSSSSSD